MTEELDKMIIGAIEAAHEDSLSDSEQVALVGRARKAMLEGALRWIYEEEKRGTDMGEVICAVAYYSGGICAKMAVALRDSSPAGRTSPTNEKIVEVFSDALREEEQVAIRFIMDEINEKESLKSLS